MIHPFCRLARLRLNILGVLEHDHTNLCFPPAKCLLEEKEDSLSVQLQKYCDSIYHSHLDPSPQIPLKVMRVLLPACSFAYPTLCENVKCLHINHYEQRESRWMSELKTDPGFSLSLLSVDLHIVFVLFQRGLEHPGRKMIQNKYTEF